jgi:hypothetical protein
MTKETYDKIKKINPDFGKPESRLGKSFRYTNDLAMERSGKPSGKGEGKNYPKYSSDIEGIVLAQRLHDEMEKSKKDPKYRPQLNEGAQFATKGRPAGPNAPSAPKGSVSEAEIKGYINRVDSPYKDIDETNRFLTKQGVETIPKVVDNSPGGKTTQADIASQGAPFFVGLPRNLASRIAPSKISPTKSQVSPVARLFDNFDEGEQDPERFGVPATNIYYNERPQYKKEEERPISGPDALRFPHSTGRELKAGVDPKSTSMAKPPIGNGAAMPGSEPGISKSQFARNDAEEEMKKKARPLKFNSLIS